MLSSLVALRFGAPLLLIFILVGMLAGEAGPGGIRFDDVPFAYTVGSVALALILFDGGLRTRYATFRSVLAPAGMLATLGVLVSAAITAPVAVFAFGFSWLEGLLIGAAVASTDAAAVFFLMHARGLRLRPRVAATLEVESGTNDPFAIFLTIVLVEILLLGQKRWNEIVLLLAREAVLGMIIGLAGGARDRVRAQPARIAARVARAFCSDRRDCGFRARPERSRDRDFLPSIWPALLSATAPRARTRRSSCFSTPPPGSRRSRCSCCSGCWPGRIACRTGCCRRLAVALVLMLIARPAAVFLCLAPFRFSLPGETVHLLGWPARRGRLLSRLDPAAGRLPNAQIYFDVGFIVVLVSLLVQGWTIAFAARRLRIAKRRVPIYSSRASSSICPGSVHRSWSATRSSRAVPICAAASSRPGRNWRWLCATST